MYILPRKMWFTGYGVGFTVAMANALLDAPTWLWVSWLVAFVLYVVVTDPAPRDGACTGTCECGTSQSVKDPDRPDDNG